MNPLFLLIIVPLVLAIAYSMHSGFKYTRMIANIFLGLKYKPAYDTVISSAGEKISILDSGGHEVSAVHVERTGADKIVIFCHDSGSAKESWEKYAYFFPDLGFHVLSIDFLADTSDVGKNSLSQWPTEEDVQKMRMVIAWVKTAFKSKTKIVLFGVSRGADIAFAAAEGEPLVAGVITDGLFSMREIFRDYIRKWAPILVKPNLFGENYPFWVVNLFTSLGFWYCQKKSNKRFVDVEKLLRKKHGPLLMIHGEFDDYVSPTHQKFLHRLSRNDCGSQRLIVSKAAHNQAVTIDREAYEKTVIGFLKKIV